jgi:hypothetical protein
VTITISKPKLALAVVAVAMLIPGSAMAFHVFDDVPDEKFYAEPVEWAFDNEITTGKTATTFAPEDNVTRGESVTFLKRYNDNVVDPAIEDVQADVDANTDDIAGMPVLHWASIESDGDVRRAGPGVNTSTSQTKRLDVGEYEVDFDVDDVSACQAIVSASDTSNLSVGADIVTAVGRLIDPSSLFIETFDSSGSSVDSAFEVQLWCDDAVFTPIIIVPTAEGADTFGQPE